MAEYKHYVRIDANNIVVGGFSDAFETAQSTDICIDQDAGRHFTLQLHDEIGRCRYKWNGTNIVERTETDKFDIDAYKIEKIAELNKKCNETILSGFSSSAISATPHQYDFTYEAQINFSGMMNAITANIAPATIIWKTIDAGNLNHSQTEFKSLYLDGLNFKNNQINKYWNLKSQVNAATTKEQIDSIVW